MPDLTVWALAKAKEIVDYEAAALIACADELKIQEIEGEITILTMAISEALLEAFSLGVASTQDAGGTSTDGEVASEQSPLVISHPR